MTSPDTNMEVMMLKTNWKTLIATTTMTTFVTAGLMVISPGVQAEMQSEQRFVYSCEVRNNQYATVPQLIVETIDTRYPLLVEREVAVEYDPVVIWTTTLASDHPWGSYEPEGRCNAVSTRMTNLATSLGSVAALQDWSDEGSVNHEKVIFIYDDNLSTRDGVIFTLQPDNRDVSADILEQFQVNLGAVGGFGYSGLEPSPIQE